MGGGISQQDGGPGFIEIDCHPTKVSNTPTNSVANTPADLDEDDDKHYSRHISQMDFDPSKKLQAVNGSLNNGYDDIEDIEEERDAIVSTFTCQFVEASPPRRLDYRKAVSHLFESIEVPILTIFNLCQSPMDYCTFHVELDLSATQIKYNVADAICICPENPASIVQEVADSLGYQLQNCFDIIPAKENFKYPFPVPCTVLTALTRYVDLMVCIGSCKNLITEHDTIVFYRGN